MPYSKQLTDPRWQKKRLLIFQRDNFMCRLCHDEATTLIVHHLCYLPNVAPWDHPDILLLTLCDQCHKDNQAYDAIAKLGRLTRVILEQKRIDPEETLSHNYSKGDSLSLDCLIFLAGK
jgi:5-methylcytosine-specific restriction endonuclease McrA